MVAGVNGGQGTAKAAGTSVVALPQKEGAQATSASAALQILLKFQDETQIEKRAAALATKTGTSDLLDYTGAKSVAAQAASSSVTSALPAGHLNQIA